MKCRLCGNDQLFLFYAEGNQGEFKYYRCPDCRLVNYDLSSGSDQEQYSNVYFSPIDNAAKVNRDQTHSYRYLSQFAKPPGRMLDIGCNNAKILYLAKQAGWKVQGLDLSPEIAARVKEEVDIDITVQDFMYYIPKEKFDVVILRHVFEHLPQPIEAMNKIRSLLNDNGVALIEVPNIDGHTKRFTRLTTRLGLRKNRYKPGRKPGHLNEFCAYSFKRLAEKTGVEVIDWQTYSSNPFSDRIYRRLNIGNKVRILLRAA